MEDKTYQTIHVSKLIKGDNLVNIGTVAVIDEYYNCWVVEVIQKNTTTLFKKNDYVTVLR